MKFKKKSVYLEKKYLLTLQKKSTKFKNKK